MSEPVEPPEPVDDEDEGLDSAVGARVVEEEPPEAPGTRPPEDPIQRGATSTPDHAGFWRRLAAYVIDSVLLALPSALVLGWLGVPVPEGSVLELSNRQLAELAGALYVVQWPYFAGFEASSWQATPGKRLLGLEVTDLEGERISLVRATVRYFSKILSEVILAIGYLMIAFTERKQGLHDLLANSLVLKR